MKFIALGAAESGVGAAILARDKGYDVFVSDMGSIKPRYKQMLDAEGIAWEEGGHTAERILQADLVVKSPGIPDTAPMVAALRERGVRLSVATATDRPPVEAALRRLSLLDSFDGIFTCTEVGRSKRHSDVFLAALHAMGGSLADAVVFEDSLHAIRTAKAAGFRVIAVPDDSAAQDRSAIRALADAWFDDYAQALKAL